MKRRRETPRFDRRTGRARTLSALDVREALEDRILRGGYRRGTQLPPVRALAAEFGTSPSTVSRALQELAADGWVRLRPRQRASVLGRAPGDNLRDEMAGMLRRVAQRWQLTGRSREEFEDLVQRILDDVFRPSLRAVFVECNGPDLERMAEELRLATGLDLHPVLIDDLGEIGEGTVVLTPYFHLAEVRRLLRNEIRVVPINFVPEASILRELADLGPEQTVGVIGADARSRRRVEGLVHQYTIAKVRATTADQRPEIERLLEDADLIVTTNAAQVDPALRDRAKRLLTVRFVLDEGEDLTGIVRQVTVPQWSGVTS